MKVAIRVEDSSEIPVQSLLMDGPALFIYLAMHWVRGWLHTACLYSPMYGDSLSRREVHLFDRVDPNRLTVSTRRTQTKTPAGVG